MKTLLIFNIVLTFSLFHLTNPKQSVAGTWKGHLIQKLGTHSAAYEFEIYLIQKGNIVQGRSYIMVDDKTATMEIIGELHGGIYLQLVETKIIYSDSQLGMEWCLKKLNLLLKKEKNKWTLAGLWDGKTSFSDCGPGKIKLKKIQPRV